MFDSPFDRSPAPGTPIRSPHRRGRPSLRERPERVEFAPAVPVALRLDPDPEQRNWYGGWRRKMELPACRLVWVGNAIPTPGKWSGWHVEILVTSLTSPADALNLQVLAVPISVLGLLTVGRVLEDPSHERRPHSFGGPGPQLRFLGSEWTIELDFGSLQTSIVSAADLGLCVSPLPPRFADSPLCVTSDPSTGKLVLITCWELFRLGCGPADGRWGQRSPLRPADPRVAGAPRGAAGNPVVVRAGGTRLRLGHRAPGVVGDARRGAAPADDHTVAGELGSLC